MSTKVYCQQPSTTKVCLWNRGWVKKVCLWKTGLPRIKVRKCLVGSNTSENAMIILKIEILI